MLQQQNFEHKTFITVKMSHTPSRFSLRDYLLLGSKSRNQSKQRFRLRSDTVAAISPNRPDWQWRTTFQSFAARPDVAPRCSEPKYRVWKEYSEEARSRADENDSKNKKNTWFSLRRERDCTTPEHGPCIQIPVHFVGCKARAGNPRTALTPLPAMRRMLSPQKTREGDDAEVIDCAGILGGPRDKGKSVAEMQRACFSPFAFPAAENLRRLHAAGTIAEKLLGLPQSCTVGRQGPVLDSGSAHHTKEEKLRVISEIDWKNRSRTPGMRRRFYFHSKSMYQQP